MNAFQGPNPFAEQNPYAAPQIPAQPGPGGSHGFPGLWRQGKLLIMHKLAPLPFICVKSNEPANQWLTRHLQWYPKWALLLGAIFAMALTKKATINIALTDEWMKRRKQRIWIAWGTAIGGLLMVVLGILIVALQTDANPSEAVMGVFCFLFFSGWIVSFGGMIFGLMMCKLVQAEKMTDTHIWISGVHPGFLDRLPEFHG